jgi:hypothetical protein
LTGQAWLLPTLVASLVWAFILYASVRGAIAAVDARFRVEVGRRSLLELARSSAEEQIADRVRQHVLRAGVENAGGTYWPWTPGRRDDPPENTVRMVQAGEIEDVWLEPLKRAVTKLALMGTKPDVGLRIGSAVASGSTIVSYSKPIPQELRREIQRAVRVRKPKAITDVGDVIESLQDEVVSASSARLQLLRAVLRAYSEALGSYAEPWSRYVRDIGDEMISRDFELDQGPVNGIRDAVLTLMEEMILLGRRAEAMELAGFPFEVLRIVRDTSATGFLRLLDLSPIFYSVAAIDRGDAYVRTIVRERSWVHLVEALEFVIPTFQAPYRDGPGQSLLEAMTTATEERLLRVARSCIAKGDLDNYAELLRRWRAATESDDDEAEMSTRAGLRGMPVPLAWAIVRRHRMAAIAGLGSWLDATGGDAALRLITNEFEKYLSNSSTPVDLSSWEMDEMKSHAGGLLAWRGDLIVAWILMATRSVGPGDVAGPFEIGPGFFDSRDDIRRAIADLKFNSAEWSVATGLKGIRARLSAVATALDGAITRYEAGERARLRAAPIDQSLVNEIVGAFDSTLRTASPLAAFADAGCVTTSTVHRGAAQLQKTFRLEQKDLFTVDRRIREDSSWFANYFARAQGARVVALVGRLLATAPPLHWRLPSLSRRILRAAEALRRRGHTPTHIFVPAGSTALRELLSDPGFRFKRGNDRSEMGMLGGLRVFAAVGFVKPVVMALPSAVAVIVDRPVAASSGIAISEMTPTRISDIRSRGINEIDGHEDDTFEERLASRVFVDLKDEFWVVVDRAAAVVLRDT